LRLLRAAPLTAAVTLQRNVAQQPHWLIILGSKSVTVRFKRRIDLSNDIYKIIHIVKFKSISVIYVIKIA